MAALIPNIESIDRDALKAQAVALRAERGYNCAQAVVCALAPYTGVDADAAFRMAEGFGAGMGAMAEVCGAISGAVMSVGALTSTGTANPTSKGHTYSYTRQIAAGFHKKNGSTICHELKGAGAGHGPLRSCPGCIEDAIDLALDVLAE